MTVIPITSHRELPRPYTFDLIHAATLAEAQTLFARRYPHYACPAVYVCDIRHWFVMDYGREFAK